MTEAVAAYTMMIDSLEMARVMGNAHAFLPARAKTKAARVQLEPTRLTVTATDGYTVGRDHCLADAQGAGPVLGLSREGLAALDKAGREDRKGVGRLEWYPGDCLKFSASDQAETVVPLEDLHPETWARVDELLTRLTDRPAGLPPVLALSTDLLMRFSKVKSDKTERCMDLYMNSSEDPVLVKIGPTFTGVIMPINREVHGTNVGADGLWTC